MPEARRSRQRGRRAALSVLLALACEAPAAAQENLQTRWIRAVGTIPPADIVDRVAKDAEPYGYPAGSRPDLELATFKRVAIERCGSLQPGYAKAFDDRNEVDFNEATTVGLHLYTAVWPACLWAREIRYTVRSGETYSTILQKVSGQGIVARPRPVAAGEQLNLIATEPTELKIPGDRLDAFIQFIAAHTRDGVRSAVGGVPPTTIGNIVEPLGASMIAGTPFDCAASDPPFDGAAVLAAYLHASKGRYPDPVEVVVVDNGFFGLECTEDGCPRFDRPWSEVFPEGIFWRNHSGYAEYSNIGPAIFAGLPPSNYHLDHLPFVTRTVPQTISDIEGHGTHVAGLALGGPGMYRGDWRARLYGTSPWLRLLILSVAPASRAISDIAADGIFKHIQLPRQTIVNMSFVLDLARPADVDKIGNEVAKQANTLFVVAAGNGGADRDGDSVGGLAPASKGGAAGTSNVVTVAALEGVVKEGAEPDSGVRLARFSNYGTAVDLAAPGCKIKSWIGGTDQTMAISGTSQAAPLVTFTASLMRSIWETSPRQLKQRLVLSGDPLPCAMFDNSPVPRCVSGQVRLNIPKALMIRDDIIRFRDRTLLSAEHPAGQPRLAFGRIVRNDVTAPACETPLRGLKRRKDGELAAYTGADALTVCPAAISAADQAATKIIFSLHGDIIEGQPDRDDDGRVVSSDPPIEREIALSDIDDIVFASESP